MYTDEDILRRLAARDHKAFEQFYDRYASRVLGLLVKIVGDRGSAEDILQDTFWRVWTGASQFNPSRGAPRTWLFVIARSRGIDFLRRRRSKTAEPAQEVAGAAQAADVEAQSNEVRHAIDALPDENGIVLRLSYFKGLTQTEISQKLSLPLGTVKTRIRLGVQKLKEKLQEVAS